MGKIMKEFYLLQTCPKTEKILLFTFGFNGYIDTLNGLNTNIKNKHIVFNISSNNPIKITKIIDDINFLVGKKAQIKKIPLQTSEMYKTHGDNSLIKKMINKKKFTSINIGLKNTVDWFVSNKDKIKLY